MPDQQFVLYCNRSYHLQLQETIEDFSNIKLSPIEERPWSAINSWIDVGKYYRNSPCRNDYLAFYLDWFNQMSITAGLPNLFHSKADLWFDYPALLKPTPLSRHFDFLVVNSVPKSDQFRFDEKEMNALISRLISKGYSVVVTNPCSVKGAICTQDYNISITGIGNISGYCDYHIMVSTGPSWSTFNVWNKNKVRLRAILLNDIVLDYSEKCNHFASITALAGFLTSNNLL
jgi:hypothetical protein